MMDAELVTSSDDDNFGTYHFPAKPSPGEIVLVSGARWEVDRVEWAIRHVEPVAGDHLTEDQLVERTFHARVYIRHA
ncbi:hypothetical protein CLV40_13814 [Actinokineospora auranticolor]|uniref:Uncharacterized protein n=2 Tax=Actinokineospora auranticolor TaxID=155976 RepID=A0A2S6GCI5_9PSEU|nr:hypothetical protein CLV40_13814 [Actinokineospora auranticolor]